MSKLERWIDTYHWWRGIERHVIPLSAPIVINLVKLRKPANRLRDSYVFPSSPYRELERPTHWLRPDIALWCSEVLQEQAVVRMGKGRPRIVFKHKSGAVMFRMRWSVELAQMERRLRELELRVSEALRARGMTRSMTGEMI